MLDGGRLHGDDTTVPLLARGGTKTARLWTYVRDDRPWDGGAPPAAFFKFSTDRRKKQTPCDVVGIFPNEASIMRLIGAVLFEQNDEWQTSSQYMMVEAFAQIDKEEIDPLLSITTKAA